MDLTEPEVGKQIVKLALGMYGRLDGLVLNHGCLEPVKRVCQVDVDAWRKGFETNFFSYLDIVSPYFWMDFRYSVLTRYRSNGPSPKSKSTAETLSSSLLAPRYPLRWAGASTGPARLR